MSKALTEGWRRDGLDAARVWVTYGLAEALFDGFVPWALLPLFVTRASPRFSLALVATALSAYAVIGFVIGASASGLSTLAARGRCVPPARPGRSGVFLGQISLLAAFALNALLRAQFYTLPAVAIALAAATSGRSDDRRPWTAAASSAWTVAFLLAGVTFACEPRSYVPLWGRAALAVLFAAAVIGIARAAHLVRGRAATRLHGANRLPGRRLGWIALAALVIVAAGTAVSLLRGGSSPGSGGAAPAVTARRAPDVILILMDTVRADHLSVYGYERDTTPSLRRFAASRATVYRNAISASNHTLSSTASILTGLEPSGHLARFFLSPDGVPLGSGLSPKVAVVSELLARRGYRTAAIVANTISLDPAFGFSRGFSSYVCRPLEHFFSPVRPAYLHAALQDAVAAVARPERRFARFIDAGHVTDEAIGVLQSATGQRQPVFLLLNYMDAHVPYQPPPPFDQRYPGRDAAFDWSRYEQVVADVTLNRTRGLTRREHDHLVSQYDGAIAYLDSELGRLFDRLRALGLYDESLVIVTSDHGEGFGGHGVLGHGVFVYEQELHVPLIVKYPGASGPEVVEERASGLDITPTILDMAGAGVPAGLDGRSLRELHRLGTRWLVSESSGALVAPWSPNSRRPPVFALYAGALKLISRPDGRRELYDTAVDRAEQTNLPMTALSAEWQAQLAAVEDAYARPALGPRVDPGNLDELRAVGYIR